MSKRKLPIQAPPVTRTMPVAVVDRIAIIGCGGTGAFLAEHLLRLVAGFGLKARVCLIDGDRVKAENLSRQQFFPWELGQNKAAALALRLGGQMGVGVGVIEKAFTGADGQQGWLSGGLVITATDTLPSRKAVAMAGGWRYWLDVGNARNTGQAILGTTHSRADLAAQWEALEREPYPRHLPTAAAINPAILRARPGRGTPATSCALQPFAEQGFGVNAMAALAAASIVRQILIDRLIVAPQIWFDVEAGRMLPRTITRDLFAPWAKADAEKPRGRQ